MNSHKSLNIEPTVKDIAFTLLNAIKPMTVFKFTVNM